MLKALTIVLISSSEFPARDTTRGEAVSEMSIGQRDSAKRFRGSCRDIDEHKNLAYSYIYCRWWMMEAVVKAEAVAKRER